MFGKFKEFVSTRNLPECKKFISDYVKEVVVYIDHIEVIFNVVFFVDNEIIMTYILLQLDKKIQNITKNYKKYYIIMK